jgi:hypothetical protein
MGMCMREIEDEDSLDQISPRLIEGERCTEYYSIINDRIVSPYIYIYIYIERERESARERALKKSIKEITRWNTIY